MKVIQINAVYKNSSTGRICFELHNFLKEKGGECLTVYGNRKGDYEDTVYLGNVKTQKVHALLTRITGKVGYFSKKQTRRLLSYIKKEQPDVVHLHNLHANFVCIPKLLKFLAEENVPTVITLHDCFFYTGQCCHYTSNACYKWQEECRDCKFNKLTWFFDRTKKMFDDKRRLFGNIKNLAVIGVSDWITNEAKKSPILGGAKGIERIYNGIDLGVFKQTDSSFRSEKGLESKKIILGVASGWSDKKGLNIFNELADRLSENEVIVLVGNANGKILNGKIVNVPATDNVERLVEIYNAADVFVQASKEETFGNVVAESLACGTPVVTNTSTANPELVNEECGIVVEDFTAENVYSAVKEILSQGKSSYSENCVKFAENNFNKEKNLSQYLELYKKIVEEKSY